jgi:DNA polymerase elongation subunit (family B)
MLYETDHNKSKRKEMGIVLKRRDNAPIVKDIYGEIINILMKEQNIQKAIQFLGDSLEKIVNGTTPIEKLIITKSLRSHYKCPNSIAHKVLADRIGRRDAGNKPCSGDRIPFVHFVPKNMNKKTLQGDKIETPNFILENKLIIDYEYYITNQIMKPLQQLFSLVLEDIWQMQHKIGKLKRFKNEVEMLKKEYITDIVKFQEKILHKKNHEVQELLFQKYLTQSTNKKQGITTIDKYFTTKK